jgi:hypothetical protein
MARSRGLGDVYKRQDYPSVCNIIYDVFRPDSILQLGFVYQLLLFQR